MTSQIAASKMENLNFGDIGRNKHLSFNNCHPYFVTIEMVNRLIAGYLRSNNFYHTFFLFCKEANISETDVFDEELVDEFIEIHEGRKGIAKEAILS